MEQTTTTAQDVPNTKEMIRKLEETTGVASSMLENLHLQGEQMDRVIDMNNGHSDQLHSAERLARELSFTGRISNLFRRKSAPSHRTVPSSKPQMSNEHPEKKKEEKKEKKEKKAKPDKKQKEEEELTPEDRIWKERADPNYVPPAKKESDTMQQGWVHPDLTEAQKQLVQEQDRDLDQMANILYSLREMSQVTNSELHNQSKKIDIMDEQIERNLNSTKKTTAKISKYA